MIYDVIIIGAGAAGLMTAIEAKRGGCKVLVLEGQAKVGAKILMSGGTRCNVTNKAVSEKDYNSGHIMRVRNILRGFSNQEAIKFFHSLGVELILEETGKYFPTTHSGKTVLEALLKEINHNIKTNHKVRHLEFKDGLFHVQGEGFSCLGHQVVLATGGLSYPSTGSDGVGYRLAAGFGHSLVATDPALTPLTTNSAEYKALSGITLNVRLTLMADNKKIIEMEDSFLFTHLGFSGPAVLDMSRHWLRYPGKKVLLISFLPQFNEQSFEALLLKNPNRPVKAFLCQYLPERLVELILKQAKVAKDLPLHQLKKEMRAELLRLCLSNPLDISGAVGYSKAEVTAGGIDFKDVSAKTLESNLQPGLFFVGEILDVDGRIGGFNFQWAWASGHTVAGEIIKRKERKSS